MPGSITAQGFSGAFSGLNGTSYISATKADIIRSLLTVGYPSRRKAALVVGTWREQMLVAMATGYLNDWLQTTAYFRNLEQSEKVGVSFLLGEAFTHWYAQDSMKVPFLLHVSALKSCKWSSPGATIALKPGAAIPNPKSRPDFIGVGYKQRHVFESKGRIRSPSNAVVSKALGQVSTIHSINGIKPTTYCASFFMLKASGAEGRIYDPPQNAKGVNLEFDTLEAIKTAYSIFLARHANLSASLVDGYLVREIEPGLHIGIDKKILGAIQEDPMDIDKRDWIAQEVFSIIADRSGIYGERREQEISPGIDGTIVLDRRTTKTQLR